MTSALTVNPETGELRDLRNMSRLVAALIDRCHSEIDRVETAGQLRLSSGRIAVTDPATHLHKQPLALDVPPGAYDVTLYWARGGVGVAAVRVDFAAGATGSIERATWSWPFQDSKAFATKSGLIALFDYGEGNNLAPPRVEQLSALADISDEATHAFVQLPRVRKWNMFVCRPARAGDGFYSVHWVFDVARRPLALLVDFAAFGGL